MIAPMTKPLKVRCSEIQIGVCRCENVSSTSPIPTPMHSASSHPTTRRCATHQRRHEHQRRDTDEKLFEARAHAEHAGQEVT